MTSQAPEDSQSLPPDVEESPPAEDPIPNPPPPDEEPEPPTSPPPVATWPDLGHTPKAVPGLGGYDLAAMAQPGYKQWVVEPRTSAHVCRTEITRASDFQTFGASNARIARPYYSRRQLWNADGSLMLIWMLTSSYGNVSGGPALVDGNSFDYIGRLSSFHGDRMIWHPTNPDLIVYPSGNKLLKFSIAKNSSSDFFTFNGYSEVTSTGLFGNEGTPSKDGRYWMGSPKNASGNYDLVSFDATSNTVLGTIPLPAGWGPSQLQGSPLNWWSVSRKGQFIVTQSLTEWTTRSGVSVPRGLNVWSLKGALLRTFSGSGSAWHIDLAVDTDGFDVAVIIGDAGQDSAGYKVRQLRSWRLDGSYGQTPRNEGPTDMTRENWHISAPMQADGWAFVSSYGNHQSNVYGKESTLFNHIYAAKLDGAKRVAVIANARHPTENASGMSNYFYESHANVRPDGAMVAWTSAWNYSAMTSPPVSHLYVARALNCPFSND